LATLTPAPLLQAVEGKKTAVVGGQYPQSQPQARAGNQATIDYGDGIQPSSSAKSAQSEKSAVQTSSTASVWEIPTALAGQPTPAAAQREHTPIPPPYIPQPPLSAKSVKSEKSAVQTSLLLSIGGLGLLLLIVIIGGASWLLNRPSEPSSDMNAQTVQSSIRQTQSAVDKQTPTLSLKGQGEYDVNVYPTITPSITNIPLATATLHSILSRISTKDGMEMIYIPASEFLMGSTESDRFADNNEKPQHKVELNGYWMDKTEVTNGMYQKCVADGACQEPNNKSSRTHADYYKNSTYANYPVIYVDSNQAVTYCKWAGGSLPSEAQWEKAARGTDGRKYPWGDVSPSCDLANYTGCGGDTKPVGSIMAGESPYGLMDMAGNVGEWVNDWYDDGYYKNSPQLNPAGPESGLSRVVRGGSWEYDSMYVRAANRDRIFHVFWGNNLGFRCVR
ncbi:MAG: formylglycine-generating enzyme family protein, partial [Chloroflexota bacterium]